MAAPAPRRVGKGRILGVAEPASGSAKSSSSPAIPDHIRNTGPLSPSGSSISADSQVSTSKSSLEDHDISTVVAANDRVVAASASSRLVCPICTEEMMTLLQLNRHLDDNHKNLEVVEQDEVKNWFKSQMVKAKRFQPLAVINQKLKGLDVFESNNSTTISSDSRVTSGVGSGASSPAPEVVRIADSDELVTREHWQRYGVNNACSDPMCGKRLGTTNGNINCRKCGKLFCEEHTMYQMKLSRSAQHEPVRGFWCRVCETCYKSREGYNDHSGVERDHMKIFSSMRRKAIDSSYLDVSRLEKRLTKLTQLLSDPALQQDHGGIVGYFRSFSGVPNQKRLLEQTVTDWEDDAKVHQCPFCQQEFTNYSFRRHHCRLCGRVICADPLTGCSTEIPLDVAAHANELQEKSPAQISMNIRMCKDCKHTLFSKSDFARELASETPDQRAFQNLKQFEIGIRTMLPRFQKLLAALQDPDKPPTSAQLTEATKVRKRLTDSFTQFSIAATRIRDFPTTSPTQLRLQRQIHSQASSFLHIHMLPLKSLPKILKHASPHGTYPNHRSVLATIDGHLAPPNGRLAAIRSSPLSGDESSSSAVSSIETEEKELRERLMVLEEQKFMVGEMLADAQRRRKFEEVESLNRNLEDLAKEIDSVQGMLGGLDFEGAYVAAGLIGGVKQ